MKTATDWSSNVSGEANNFAYDSPTVAYDSSTNNYDGVVDTDMSDREINPLDWNRVDKLPTAWSNTNPKTPTDWSEA